jgi:hypothetical protein
MDTAQVVREAVEQDLPPDLAETPGRGVARVLEEAIMTGSELIHHILIRAGWGCVHILVGATWGCIIALPFLSHVR